MNNKVSLVAAGSFAVMVCLVVSLWRPWEESGGYLQLYCAAGLYKAVNDIVTDYEKECGVKVILDAGPSGMMRSRVIASKGAIGDLFLPADRHYIDEIKALNLSAEEFLVGYFEAVIAVPRGNPKNITTLDDLFRDDVRVGLGNPQASIGRTVKRILTPLGYWEKIEKRTRMSPPKITFLGKVTEVALQVKKNVVDAGIVWKATAIHNGLDYVELAPFAENKRPLVLTVLKKTKKPMAAIQFARYLTARDKGLVTFAKHSYQTIEEGDLWHETIKE